MHRSFAITLPADTAYHNLYSLIVGTTVYGSAQGGTNETAITGAIPTDGILPDRVSQLDIQSDISNGGGTITIGDRNNANTNGVVLTAASADSHKSDRNTICIKDYDIKGSAVSLKINVSLDSI